MNLVIVESPTKARKLKSYLGSDFQVEASVGHVRDLPSSSLGVDLEHDYQPVYEVSPDKLKVVKQLKRLSKTASKIYLATDPDREGEAIAWHVKYLLQHDDKGRKLKGEKSEQFLRAVFHEITKDAVLAAIAQPGKINSDLVDAQQARRVLDRLVGYQISPVLWKKIRRGLSAGRVQSVALRLIVEREREIEAFKAEEYWEMAAAVAEKNALSSHPSSAALKKLDSKGKYFNQQGKLKAGTPQAVFVINLEQLNQKKLRIKDQKQAAAIRADLAGAAYQVLSVEKTQRRRASLPPFTTSLLQQAAANLFGYSVKQTMRLAQQLYEEGLITYHRTDSFNLAGSAVNKARAYITEHFGQEFCPAKPRFFANKSKNAQEAHEAIRVTDINLSKDQVMEQAGRLTEQHARLYDLIWRRFVASQMSEALYDQTTVLVEATAKSEGEKKYGLRANGSVLKFAGWRKLFNTGEDSILPDVKEGEVLDLHDLSSLQKFTQPPDRYNDASLVKELEKRGIGRPSTYAAIISVIIDRAYVERQQKKFFATAIGMTVNDFLIKHFPDLLDYDFTAEMEEDLDRIARGEKAWVKTIDIFYKPLAKKINQVNEKAKRVQVPVETTGEECPECLKQVAAGQLKASEVGQVVIRSGRYGKFKSCSRFPDCKYTENIVETLQGQHCPLCREGAVIVRPTRFGKVFYGCSRYPECDWASWKKPEPNFTLTAKEWAVVKAKREEWKKRFQSKNKTKTVVAKTKTSAAKTKTGRSAAKKSSRSKTKSKK